MVTGGYGISEKLARKMYKAGIVQCSVSVDGLEETHDQQRGRRGSWQFCFKTIRILNKNKILTTCNTQINKLSAPELFELYEILRAEKIKAWQLQLTVPMGNAVDNWEILLQPSELLELYPQLAELAIQAKKDGIWFLPGNNIGYFGPFERLLRGGEKWTFWKGCRAGLNSLGIEADGAIKGCPSLPTKPFTGGNIREKSLVEIVSESEELNFNKGLGTEHLWGFCKSCEYAEVCRAGCSWTAHAFLGKRGNNPYCHHRVLVQKERGIREKLVLKKKAKGDPFDCGEFEIIEEKISEKARK
jgi:radical SAM protein with 4Fe4S-binding SPASM domain